MHVIFKRGVHLPELDLWLDPHSVKPAAFVTHAHGDHMRDHGRVFSTAPTAALMRARGAIRAKFHEIAYGEPVSWGRAQVTQYPAGHVLGSSQMLVENDGVRLLYSGDFKLRPGLSCETVEVPEADIVIMETTFAKPRYVFPDTQKVVDDIRNWCEGVLSCGEVPVLLCYSLGKGQEVLAGLQGASFPIYLQTAHYKLTKVYQECGVQFPEFRRYEVGTPLQGALLCAGQCRKTRWFREICAAQRVRTAYISGWALDPWRCQSTDVAFPLSDHAGYDDLLEYVRLTKAKRVYTLHGFEEEFAADLTTRGIEAWPLREAAQAPKMTQLSLF